MSLEIAAPSIIQDRLFWLELNFLLGYTDILKRRFYDKKKNGRLIDNTYNEGKGWDGYHWNNLIRYSKSLVV